MASGSSPNAVSGGSLGNGPSLQTSPSDMAAAMNGSSNYASNGAMIAGAGRPGGTSGGFMGGGLDHGTFGAGPTTAEFSGKSADASRDPASGSADPDDYFLRLNANDDLFKVVAHRYQLTSMSWAKTPIK